MAEVRAMAEVGAMVASAVLKVVTQQIGSAIGGQIKLQQNFKDDLQKMKNTLESIEAVLQDAERRSIKDAAVRLWLKRLKEAMYDISDMIDEFEAYATKPAARKWAVKIPRLTIVPKIAMARKMKRMRDKLKEITDQHHCFSFTADSSSNEKQVNDKRATSSYLEEPLIVGRTKDEQKLLEILSEGIIQATMVQRITILPIYGIGGIGKTTLAKLVFNHTQFKNYCQVWIYVSQTFDLNKIGNSIISQVSKKESQTTDRQMIHNCLRELLADREILIVLDDLWETNAFLLEDLKAMLKVGNGRMVIVIVTTRDEGIAKKICTVEPYKLEPLTDDMCWNIIKQKSAFEQRDDTERLEQIGRDIAVKCGGVALAAQSLGYMLQSMTFDEWVSLRNSDIWKESTSEYGSLPHHNVLASLLLSYSSMPSYLKLCFSYCAILPQGHKIVKDDLIHQWIALGFIEPSSIFSTRQVSESYVKQLLGMSFLQHAKSPSSDGMLCEDVFTMHDLVHDLARSVMADEVLHASKTDNIGGSSCRYALLTDCSKPLNLSVTSPTKIRALCFLDYREIELNDAALSSAKHVRVLDLSGCKIRKLPHSIALLKQLRYLNAPRIHDEPFPECITKLSKLNYLNLRESYGISTLPESIGEMEGLMHLDLSGCQRIKKLPKSFVKLTDMVHLDLSHCYRVQGVPEALGGLTKLQCLNLPRSDDELRYYSRDVLPLRGLPDVIVSLTKLRYLNLSRCMMFIFGDSSTEECDSFIDRISTLSNLEHLDLSWNYNLVSIPESIGSLKKLRTLDLSGCTQLERLPESMAKMDSLKALNVKNCFNLDKSTLSQTNPFALLPYFVVHAGDGESRSNLVLLQHVNPDWLKISRLENVKSSQEAQSIKLMEKQRIEGLEFEWTRHIERSVEDMEVLGELVPPSTLWQFKIKRYSSVSFPIWLMDIRHFLPNLNQIEMEDLPNCKCLPPLGQLPNLEYLLLADMHGITKIDEGFYGGARAFPQLQVFELRGMKSLEEWNTTYSSGEEAANELMFPNLECLTINNCPMLRMKPHPSRAVQNWRIERSDTMISSWGETVSHIRASSSSARVNLRVRSCKVPLHRWRLLHHLPTLRKLTINNCSDLTGSPEIIRHLSSLESLYLTDQFQAELPKWLGELTSLQQLELERYSCLKELQGNLRQLTSLQKLSLSECRSMTSLPPWLGELTSLQSLSIRECMGIKSLPDSIQQLTSLRELRLSQCGSMTSLPPWLGELTSLQYLDIRECMGIKSLPDSTQQLTNLKHLNISFCPELKKWGESEENKKKLAHINRKCIIG